MIRFLLRWGRGRFESFSDLILTPKDTIYDKELRDHLGSIRYMEIPPFLHPFLNDIEDSEEIEVSLDPKAVFEERWGNTVYQIE